MADKNQNDRSLDDVTRAYSSYTNTPSYSYPVATGIAPLITPPAPFMNYTAAQSYQQSYPTAQFLSYTQGNGGMNLPNAQFMSPSYLGGFRGVPQSPLSGQPFRQRPVAGYYPFPARPEQAMFSRPEMLNYGYEEQRSRYLAAQEVAGGDALAATMTGMLGAGVGALGGMYGGIGMQTGAAIGGAVANFIPGVNHMVSTAMRPAIRDYGYAARLQAASQRYFVGGGGLNPTGQGLTMPAALQVAQGAGATAASSGGMFNRRDIVNLTQQFGDVGLLDAAQNPEQIINKVKELSKVVGMFARISGDPDIRNSVRLMGQMHNFGSSSGEMIQAARSIDMYSRSAGMSFSGVMEQAAMPGALAFQNAGLSGIAGMRAGAFSQAQAQQMVASGAVNSTQLGLVGGVSGLAQSNMQTQAAFLSGQGLQQIMPYLVKKGANGELTLDQDKLSELKKGGFSLSQMVAKGAGSIRSPQDIQALSAQMPELQSQFASQMGPQGTQMAMLNLAQAIRLQTGNMIDLTTALRHMGMDATQARVTAQAASSPAFWANQRQQVTLEDARERMEAFGERGRHMHSALGQIAYDIRDRVGLGRGIESMYGKVSGYFAEQEQRNKDRAMGFESRGLHGMFGGLTREQLTGMMRTPSQGFSTDRLGSIQQLQDQYERISAISEATSSFPGASLIDKGKFLLNTLDRVSFGANYSGKNQFNSMMADFAKREENISRTARAFKGIAGETLEGYGAERSLSDKLKGKVDPKNITKFVNALGRGLAIAGHDAGNMNGPSRALGNALAELSPDEKNAFMKMYSTDKSFRHMVLSAGGAAASDIDPDAFARLQAGVGLAGGTITAIGTALSADELTKVMVGKEAGIAQALTGTDDIESATQLAGFLRRSAKEGGAGDNVKLAAIAALKAGAGTDTGGHRHDIISALMKDVTPEQQKQLNMMIASLQKGGDFEKLGRGLKGNSKLKVEDVLNTIKAQGTGIGGIEDVMGQGFGRLAQLAGGADKVDTKRFTWLGAQAASIGQSAGIQDQLTGIDTAAAAFAKPVGDFGDQVTRFEKAIDRLPGASQVDNTQAGVSPPGSWNITKVL